MAGGETKKAGGEAKKADGEAKKANANAGSGEFMSIAASIHVHIFLYLRATALATVQSVILAHCSVNSYTYFISAWLHIPFDMRICDLQGEKRRRLRKRPGWDFPTRRMRTLESGILRYFAKYLLLGVL